MSRTKRGQEFESPYNKRKSERGKEQYHADDERIRRGHGKNNGNGCRYGGSQESEDRALPRLFLLLVEDTRAVRHIRRRKERYAEDARIRSGDLQLSAFLLLQ